jgi:hypothetical protein
MGPLMGLLMGLLMGPLMGLPMGLLLGLLFWATFTGDLMAIHRCGILDSKHGSILSTTCQAMAKGGGKARPGPALTPEKQGRQPHAI